MNAKKDDDQQFLISILIDPKDKEICEIVLKKGKELSDEELLSEILSEDGGKDA